MNVSREKLNAIAEDKVTTQEQMVKYVANYLKDQGVDFTREALDDEILFRLAKCPIKDRECGDRSFVIVADDGDVRAGCHGGKCEGKGWTEFQACWSSSFDEWLTATGTKKPKKQRSADGDPTRAIVEAALKEDVFFHDPNGVAYVQTLRRGHRDTIRVRENTYRHILRLRYSKIRKGVAKIEWLKNAIEQLEANAIEHGDEHPVFVRAGHHAGNVYIDIGDRNRHIVEVTADGWKVQTDCPIYFRRPKSMRPLPLPEKGGTIDQLRELVNIDPSDIPLYAAMLVMVFHPTGPYPIASFIGGPGRAKSSTVRYTRSFVDPSNVSGAAKSRSNEDLLIAAQDRRLLTFDNLDDIDQAQSDDLCRLATGASFSRRTLYSDCDETTFVAKNPVIITSINDVIEAPDLLDRSIRFVLPLLPKVNAEAVQDAAVAKAAPQVLGLILDGVVSALRNLSTTVIENPPRMVEFALWGTAAEEGLGLKSGAVMEAYRRNIGEVNELALDGEFAQKIVDIGYFKGKLKELAERLDWGTSPQKCRELAGHLRKLSSALRQIGVAVNLDLPSSGGSKVVEIRPIHIEADRRVSMKESACASDSIPDIAT